MCTTWNLTNFWKFCLWIILGSTFNVSWMMDDDIEEWEDHDSDSDLVRFIIYYLHTYLLNYDYCLFSYDWILNTAPIKLWAKFLDPIIFWNQFKNIFGCFVNFSTFLTFWLSYLFIFLSPPYHLIFLDFSATYAQSRIYIFFQLVALKYCFCFIEYWHRSIAEYTGVWWCLEWPREHCRNITSWRTSWEKNLERASCVSFTSTAWAFSFVFRLKYRRSESVYNCIMLIIRKHIIFFIKK